MNLQVGKWYVRHYGTDRTKGKYGTWALLEVTGPFDNEEEAEVRAAKLKGEMETTTVFRAYKLGVGRCYPEGKKPRKKKLPVNSVLMRKILLAVTLGKRWWGGIKEFVYESKGEHYNMPLNVTLCRLVVRGMLKRVKKQKPIPETERLVLHHYSPRSGSTRPPREVGLAA